jgi:uncharacterized protein YjbI with pentapeptide repeats
MADPEHVEILKEGVEVWNKWREKNPDIEPDLSEADLEGLILDGLNNNNLEMYDYDENGRKVFSGFEDNIAQKLDFRKVKLKESFLSGAKLRKADLREADLREAYLNGTILRRANLIRANLFGADLNGVDLRDANLTRANLSFTRLNEATLEKTNFTTANLSNAIIVDSNLIDSELYGANLCEANLFGSDLSRAKLSRAKLNNTNMKYSKLVQAEFTRANLTGAYLYGTSRDNWIIKNVICDYVFWDEEDEEDEIRLPKNRDFEPGEFEKLYAELPTIEYFFENGMSPLDPLIIDRVVQAIRERKQEFDLKIDSINARGLAPSIKFTVIHEEHKGPALDEIKKEYEGRITELQADKSNLYYLLSKAIDKSGDFKLNLALPGGIAADEVNIDQSITHISELEETIKEQPEETLPQVAKRKTLEILHDCLKDVAKGKVKEAAAQIVGLATDLGPILTQTAAFTFFKGLAG